MIGRYKLKVFLLRKENKIDKELMRKAFGKKLIKCYI
jgi:hypothetical protein